MKINVKRFTKNDYLITALIFLALTLIETATNSSMLTPDRVTSGFAAEYGNIAASVAKGDGFANVFTENSGPTAWHPPLTVYLLASVFYLFGVKSFASMWVLYLIRNLSLAFVGFFLLKISDKSGLGRYRWISLLIYLFLLFLNHDAFLYGISDVFLIVLLSSIMVYSIVILIQEPWSKKSFNYLYILAFTLPLTTPSMAMAFVAVLFVYFVIVCFKVFQDPRKSGSFFKIITRRPDLKAIVISGIIFIFAVGSWSYRNYLVFDKFIPLKSNLWVEFYFANVLDDDGELSKQFFRKHHPFKGAYLLDKYLAEGEVKFVEDSKAKAQQKLKEDPSDYFKRVGVRMVNAFIHTDHIPDTYEANMELFSEEEEQALDRADLMVLEQWTSLKFSKEEFIKQIKPLHLENEQAAIDDWAMSKKKYTNRKYGVIHLTIGIFLSLIPFLCFIFGLFVTEIRKNTVFIVTSVIYFVHLLPYILVSHQHRYQYALVALQTIFMFFTACVLLKVILSLLHRNQLNAKPGSFSNPNPNSKILQES